MKLKDLVQIGTLVIAIVSGAYWLGNLEGRVKLLDPEKIKRLTEELKRKTDPVPVGTVIASMIPPEIFLRNWPDWALANGDRIPVNSEYEKLVQNNANLPDLRGVFLRGLNVNKRPGEEGYDPNGDRLAGHFQSYTTALPTESFSIEMQSAGNHRHQYQTHVEASGKEDHDHSPANKYTKHMDTKPSGEHTHDASIIGGDSETRPSNVSVYFYIKVDSG